MQVSENARYSYTDTAAHRLSSDQTAKLEICGCMVSNSNIIACRLVKCADSSSCVGRSYGTRSCARFEQRWNSGRHRYVFGSFAQPVAGGLVAARIPASALVSRLCAQPTTRGQRTVRRGV